MIGEDTGLQDADITSAMQPRLRAVQPSSDDVSLAIRIRLRQIQLMMNTIGPICRDFDAIGAPRCMHFHFRYFADAAILRRRLSHAGECRIFIDSSKSLLRLR